MVGLPGKVPPASLRSACASIAHVAAGVLMQQALMAALPASYRAVRT